MSGTGQAGGLNAVETPHKVQPGRLYWSHDGRIGSTQRGAGGGRYLIHRWDNQWLIHFMPAPGYPGVAQQMERVPWIGDRRTLRTAQQSCTAHARRTAEKDRKREEQWAREFGERGLR